MVGTIIFFLGRPPLPDYEDDANPRELFIATWRLFHGDESKVSIEATTMPKRPQIPFTLNKQMSCVFPSLSIATLVPHQIRHKLPFNDAYKTNKYSQTQTTIFHNLPTSNCIQSFLLKYVKRNALCREMVSTKMFSLDRHLNLFSTHLSSFCAASPHTEKFIVDAVKRVIQGFPGVLFCFARPMFDMGSISSP